VSDGPRLHFPDHHGAASPPDDDGRSLAWDLDNVQLTSVGIDVGSSTSLLLFSRLHLKRLAQSLSSRFVVVARQVLHRSPILLTPFRPDGLIDGEALGSFVRQAYEDAGLGRDDVDTGAVVLTGVALERRNARPLAELLGWEGGRFVCASAGHNLEAMLAAHGSGAVALSAGRPADTVLHVDVGGGTSKLALVRGGRVEATAAVAVGARLVVLAGDGTVARVEPAAARHAARCGVKLARGGRLAPADRDRLATAMAEVLAAAAGGSAPDLLLTDPLPTDGRRPTLITFSGGVAEHLHGRERRRFGDLAPELAAAIRRALDEGGLPGAWTPLDEGIRATVVGASQFTVQVSGSTVHLAGEQVLPLRALPVVDARSAGAHAAGVAAAVAAGLRRLDLADGGGPLAVALSWSGEPHYRRLRELAAGLAAGLPRSLASGVPVVLALDADVGRSLGQILVEEFAPAARLVALDGLDLRELDYLDVGEMLQPAGVVPVVVRSLAFPAATADPD